MRLVIPSSTAILLGFQIIYSAFFVSILEIRASRPAEGTIPDRSAARPSRPYQAGVCCAAAPSEPTTSNSSLVDGKIPGKTGFRALFGPRLRLQAIDLAAVQRSNSLSDRTEN